VVLPLLLLLLKGEVLGDTLGEVDTEKLPVELRVFMSLRLPLGLMLTVTV
jgi:hypothetical protein